MPYLSCTAGYEGEDYTFIVGSKWNKQKSPKPTSQNKIGVRVRVTGTVGENTVKSPKRRP